MIKRLARTMFGQLGNQSGAAPDQPECAGHSTALRIRIVRSGKTRADLSFPASAAAYLSDLIPPEVEAKLAARAFDARQISLRAKESGFRPEELFHLVEGADQFRIWLE